MRLLFPDVLKRPSHRWLSLLVLCGLMAIPEMNLLPRDGELGAVRKRDFLQVYTRNTPTSFYEGRQGPTGFEYELFTRFARTLGVSLAVDRENNIAGILGAVRTGKADLGAAGLPLTTTTPGVRYSRPLMTMQPLVIYHRGLRRPRTPEDLIGLDIAVLSNAGPDSLLRNAQASLPALSWKESSDLEVNDLLELVNDGRLDAAVIYEHQFKLNRLFYPQVENAFSLGHPLSLVWAFPADTDISLLSRANQFIDTQRRNGTLDQLIERYFGHDDYLEYVGARRFINQVKTTLPRYQALFQKAARETGIDWKMLAALGYQESHWRPDAVSPTGVRGLMMLTRPTARRMGIANRRDAHQSIDGGSRYLASVRRRLPASIKEPDRTWMAMASYNIGLGHVLDARRVARMQGQNPDLWKNIKTALPLLQKRQWYQQVPHGYAPGHVAVYYVRNIRRYHDILSYVTRSQQRFEPLRRFEESNDLPSFDTIPPVD
ncbi:membrane-bound lytic murein transglycosylase MltF [Larsenimonas rhizosphaerae]|uniref:Membrane-bound lytic murein transglycosylase F n=1 Tax=Larsenimonas rhizosphaerae TaxID=2944682 RepID=A0AA42CSQ2_9GAMM|nr:membrane-bound lytic murein transglycosylase MltF [Larsenimonas rhizosphaerae]MCM2130100.1 membrane-bound lytic murein transglycosylase MltF [Larsenimonas rhizosphaerae]MCX2522787.1 membrane-bound lytic murein transglycosylase MltF [Larsenimonas rhizosphaerae]